MYRFLFWAGICACFWACGPKVPPRCVIERDIEGYRYQRYQRVLDVELPIEGSAAVAHTATYVRGGENVLIAPVMVTSYERASGLAEVTRQRLRSMDGYTLNVTEIAGHHVWQTRGSSGDSWVLWVSNRYVAKIGAPEGESEVPEGLVEAYLDVYPSDLDEKGRAKEGRSSAGAAVSDATKGGR